MVRKLEDRSIPTQNGHALWQRSSIHRILNNTAYYGLQYYYKTKRVLVDDIRKGKVSKTLTREVAEWIPVSIPTIITRELFDRAQEKMEKRDFFGKIVLEP